MFFRHRNPELRITYCQEWHLILQANIKLDFNKRLIHVFFSRRNPELRTTHCQERHEVEKIMATKKNLKLRPSEEELENIHSFLRSHQLLP